jgi:hypothetical protein
MKKPRFFQQAVPVFDDGDCDCDGDGCAEQHLRRYLAAEYSKRTKCLWRS